MSFLITASGRRYEFAQPSRNVHLPDIAQHLARQARFCGATTRPYSVAEHSVLVSEIAEHQLGLPPIVCLAALLHDAHEAYFSDVPTPIKDLVPGLRDEEDRIQAGVLQALNVFETYTKNYAAIKHCDLIALATERRDLMPADGSYWPCLNDISAYTGAQLHLREGMAWDDWRNDFIDRYDDLQYRIGLKVQAVYVHGPDGAPPPPSAAQRFCRRLLDPEDLGWAANRDIRNGAREALGFSSLEQAG
jgi:5'-deoxynucleotidase YfbR-like HD superfamily hydrolase